MPPFAVSLVVAETFYKFGSFSLECIAFLVTWYVLAFVYRTIIERSSEPKVVQRGTKL